MLDNKQKERHARGISLPDVGEEGQAKLLNASVLVVGIGAIGSVVSTYLSAVGVGRIGLVDFDTIDMDDLQHQILYEMPYLNRPKVRCAQERLEKMSPNTKIEGHFEVFGLKNALALMKNYEFIVDASNDFKTAFIINQACVVLKKPFSSASYFEYLGEVLSFIPQSACFACTFGKIPSQELHGHFRSGVSGFSTGILGSIQAGEVIKYFLHKDSKDFNEHMLLNTIALVDSQKLSITKITTHKDPNCPACGQNARCK